MQTTSVISGILRSLFIFAKWLLLLPQLCYLMAFVIYVPALFNSLSKEIKKNSFGLLQCKVEPVTSFWRSLTFRPMSLIPLYYLRTTKSIRDQRLHWGSPNTWVADGNYYMDWWSYHDSSGMPCTTLLQKTGINGLAKKMNAWCQRLNWKQDF